MVVLKHKMLASAKTKTAFLVLRDQDRGIDTHQYISATFYTYILTYIKHRPIGLCMNIYTDVQLFLHIIYLFMHTISA